jgi:hypothetical protein
MNAGNYKLALTHGLNPPSQTDDKSSLQARK